MQLMNEIAEYLQGHIVFSNAIFEQNIPTIRTMPETMSTALPGSMSRVARHCLITADAGAWQLPSAADFIVASAA